MKKIVKKVKEETISKANIHMVCPVTASYEFSPKVTINEIGTDYGREDINTLAKKVNEIIRELNK